MKFHEALNFAMLKYDVKQADISKAAGIPSGTMSLYCTGKRIPSVTNAIAIADAIGISLDELCGRVGQDRSFQDERQEAINTAYENMNESGRSTLSNVAASLEKDLQNKLGN